MPTPRPFGPNDIKVTSQDVITEAIKIVSGLSVNSKRLSSGASKVDATVKGLTEILNGIRNTGEYYFQDDQDFYTYIRRQA